MLPAFLASPSIKQYALWHFFPLIFMYSWLVNGTTPFIFVIRSRVLSLYVSIVLAVSASFSPRLCSFFKLSAIFLTISSFSVSGSPLQLYMFFPFIFSIAKGSKEYISGIFVYPRRTASWYHSLSFTASPLPCALMPSLYSFPSCSHILLNGRHFGCAVFWYSSNRPYSFVLTITCVLNGMSLPCSHFTNSPSSGTPLSTALSINKKCPATPYSLETSSSNTPFSYFHRHAKSPESPT